MIDPLKDYPGYLLRRSSLTAMASLAKRLEGLSIRPTEASVLCVIAANPNSTHSEIGRLLDIASANMAPLISRLADRELLERLPMDGRSHGLALTRAGRTLTRQIQGVIDQHEAALLARIPVAQRSAFLAGLRALVSSES